MLYILCQNSFKYKTTIKTIFEKLGEADYEVLDPRVNDLNRTLSNVIVCGPIPDSIKINAHKVWQTGLPDPDETPDNKKKVFLVFQEAIAYNRANGIKKDILQKDLPRLADLKQFLESFKGQVMELKLQDGRVIGIYPDGEKLPLKYSSEYHVSTILNLSKLQDIFGFIKLSVKDL
jgi:hypothetical protein